MENIDKKSIGISFIIIIGISIVGAIINYGIMEYLTAKCWKPGSELDVKCMFHPMRDFGEIFWLSITIGLIATTASIWYLSSKLKHHIEINFLAYTGILVLLGLTGSKILSFQYFIDLSLTLIIIGFFYYKTRSSLSEIKDGCEEVT